jgi:hypothetical protein
MKIVMGKRLTWLVAALPYPQHNYGHHSYTNDWDMDPDTHHFENVSSQDSSAHWRGHTDLPALC